MNPRFRSHAKQSVPKLYLAWGALACLVVIFLFYRSNESFKSRVNSAAAKIEHTVQTDLSVSKTRLLQQIEAWNARAQLQGLHSQQIHVGDHATVAAAGGGMVSSKAATAASCACDDKAPPDPKWPMKPAKEVEVEAPELAAALKKYAVNNEVMLALGRCRNVVF